MTTVLNLAAIHAAVKAQLTANIARDVTVYDFDPGENRSYPCIVVNPGDPYVEYHETFGANGLCKMAFRVQVMIVAAELDQRIALADFASDGVGATSSIRAALETDTSWGGAVTRSCVYRCSGLDEIEPGVLAATFDVEADAHRGGT